MCHMSVTLEVFRFSIPSIASNFSHSINQELQDVGRADANETSNTTLTISALCSVIHPGF